VGANLGEHAPTLDPMSGGRERGQGTGSRYLALRRTYVAGLDWTRGSAHLARGHVVLTDSTEYEPSTTRDVLYDILALRTTDDILAFVREHGLLTERRREPLERWWTERRALGAALAIAQPDLAPQWTVVPERIAIDGRVREIRPTDDLAALVVSTGLARHVEYRIVVPKNLPFATLPPGVHYGGLWIPRNLLGCAYIELMSVMLVAHKGARLCVGCGRPFLPADPRQRFHSGACANLARQRTYRERQRTRQGGGSRDQSTDGGDPRDRGNP